MAAVFGSRFQVPGASDTHTQTQVPSRLYSTSSHLTCNRARTCNPFHPWLIFVSILTLLSPSSHTPPPTHLSPSSHPPLTLLSPFSHPPLAITLFSPPLTLLLLNLLSSSSHLPLTLFSPSPFLISFLFRICSPFPPASSATFPFLYHCIPSLLTPPTSLLPCASLSHVPYPPLDLT
jgi:hypothetical protein